MSGVNIFGEALSSNKNTTVQREPPGKGFNYLDGSGNFDIRKKRLEKMAKPEEYFDAVNNEFLYNRYDFLHAIYERYVSNRAVPDIRICE